MAAQLAAAHAQIVQLAERAEQQGLRQDDDAASLSLSPAGQRPDPDPPTPVINSQAADELSLVPMAAIQQKVKSSPVVEVDSTSSDEDSDSDDAQERRNERRAMRAAITAAKKPPAARTRAVSEVVAVEKAAVKEQERQFYYRVPGDAGAPSPTTIRSELGSSMAVKSAADVSDDSDGEEEEQRRTGEDTSEAAVRERSRSAGGTVSSPPGRSTKKSDEGARGRSLSLQEHAWAMAERDAKRHLRAAREVSVTEEEGVPPD